MSETVGLIIRGACIGLADLVPGVSGGTIALLLGIYPRLLTALAQLQRVLFLLCRVQIRQALATVDLAFFLPLGVGALASIVCFSLVITWLLNNAEDFVLVFFLGVVLVTAWTLLGKSGKRWFHVLAIAAGILVSWGLQQLPVLPTQPNSAIFFLAGAFAICAMLLPGISGSLLLLTIGMYRPVIESVVNRDLISLSVFGFGAIVGLLLFSRLLLYVYTHYRLLTLSCLTGFTFGSITALVPQQQVDTNLLIGQQVIYYPALAILFLLGILGAFYLARFDQQDRD